LSKVQSPQEVGNSLSSLALKDLTLSLFKELKILTRGSPLKLEDEITRMRLWLSKDRESRPSGYMNQPKAFSAYTAFHLPLHLTETFWIFEQNFQRIGLKTPEKILDLGSGPGTATLSLLLWLHSKKLPFPKEVTFFDQSTRALDASVILLKSLYQNAGQSLPKIRKLHGNLFHRKILKDLRGDYDLVILSHVLNEFGNGPRHRPKKMDFFESLEKDLHLAPGTLLLIIEPPLREPTLDLMWLRDQLSRSETLNVAETKSLDEVDEEFDDQLSFEGFNARVLAPCPSGTKRCPMLLARAGWCYAQPPREYFRARGLCPWDYEIESTVRIEWTQPGFSYLLLGLKNQNIATENPEWKTSHHGIALTDSTRAVSMICRENKMRREARTPFRGAYLEHRTKSPRFNNSEPEDFQSHPKNRRSDND